MRILFVAPAAPGLGLLDTGAELARIASGNQINVCDGNVDRTKLELSLRDGQFDVVHFAQHGSRRGLELTDGTLEVADLVSMLEPQKALKLLFVNACNSVATGIELHNAFHVPTVAHDAPINDRAAVAFAETFYRAWRATDIGSAFERGIKTLQVRFPEEARTPQLINGDMADKACMDGLRAEMTRGFQALNTRMDGIEVAVTELNNGRSKGVATMTITLLVLLLIAQVLTPVLNAWLR